MSNNPSLRHSHQPNSTGPLHQACQWLPKHLTRGPQLSGILWHHLLSRTESFDQTHDPPPCRVSGDPDLSSLLRNECNLSPMWSDRTLCTRRPDASFQSALKPFPCFLFPSSRSPAIPRTACNATRKWQEESTTRNSDMALLKQIVLITGTK